MILDISQTMIKYEKIKEKNVKKIFKKFNKICFLSWKSNFSRRYIPIGSSFAYPIGAFHLLTHLSLMKKLPKKLSSEQVLCGLTAVIKK